MRRRKPRFSSIHYIFHIVLQFLIYLTICKCTDTLCTKFFHTLSGTIPDTRVASIYKWDNIGTIFKQQLLRSRWLNFCYQIWYQPLQKKVLKQVNILTENSLTVNKCRSSRSEIKVYSAYFFIFAVLSKMRHVYKRSW